MRRHETSTILLACTAAFFVTFYARLAISPVVPFIAADFEVSNAIIGLSLTGMWLAYGIAQYPSGILGDRFGEKTVVLLAVSGTTIAVLLLAWSPYFVLFTVFVFALGGLAGLHYSPATNLLSRTFDNIGRAIGVHLLGAPVAGLTAPIIAAWIGVRYGWRPAIATAIIVGVPTYLLVARGIPRLEPRHPSDAMRSRFGGTEDLRVIIRPAIMFTLLISMLGTFVIQGLLSFLPTFLMEQRTLSPAIAGLGFSAFFVVRAIAQFLLGSISDIYGRDLAIAGAMLCGAIGVAGLVVAPTMIGIVLGLSLAGFGMGFFAVTDPRFLDNLADAEQGSGFGLIRTVYVVIGSAGSVSVGLMADVLGWDVSFLVLAGLLGAAFLAMIVNKSLGLGY